MTYQTPSEGARERIERDRLFAQYAPVAGGDLNPADDPRGYLGDLLARYFRPGLVDSLARTWVPIAVGSILAWINANWSVVGLPEKPSATAAITATGVTIAAYYWAARTLERRFPRLGRWLVAFNLTRARPTYAEPAAAAQVEAAAARTTARHF